MIRTADNSDVEPIVEMCRAFIAEGTYAGLITFEQQPLTEFVQALISAPNADILITDGYTGMLAIVAEFQPLTGKTVAGELFWWARPGCRGVTGWRLEQAAEQWARNRGAAALRMGAPDERVGSMLQRAGFKRAEIMFQKELS